MRVTPWLLVLTIESGYLLRNGSHVIRANQSWFISGFALTVLVIGFVAMAAARKKRSITREQRLRWKALGRLVSYLPWLTSTIMVGGLYGDLRSVNSQASLDSGLGRPVLAEAVVQRVHPFTGGLTINLRVTSLRTDNEAHRGRLDAVWFLRDEQALDEAWQEGSRVALSGTFVDQAVTTHTRRTYLPQQGPKYQFIGRALQVTPSSPSLPDKVRKLLHTSIEKVMGTSTETEVKLLESLVFGGSELDSATKQSFLAAGLLHVLAASGANVLLLQQFLELTVFKLLRRLRFPYSIWVVVLIAFLWFFADLCGFAASIVRATTMSSYALIGRLLQRPVTTYSGLRMTALIEVLWDPALLSNASSILSFAATAAVAQALVRFRQPSHLQMPKTWGRVLLLVYHFLRRTLLVNLWVDLYLLPVMMAFFQQLTPFGVLSNFVAEPLLNLLLPLAVAFMFLSIFQDLANPVFWLAHLLGRASFLLLQVLTGVTNTVASWPFSLLHVSMPSLWWAGVYYGLFLVAKRDKKFVKK